MVMYREKGYTREQSLTAVGPGWAKLINHLWDVVEAANVRLAALPGAEPSWVVRVVQVKEKFGRLCFYTDRHAGPDMDSPGLFAAIQEATAESMRTCEECGEPGKNYAARTLCIRCAVAHDLEGYDEST